VLPSQDLFTACLHRRRLLAVGYELWLVKTRGAGEKLHLKYLRGAVQEGWGAAPGDVDPPSLVILEHARSGTPSVTADLLGQALDTVSEGSLITDADQNVVYANKAFEAVTGYSAEEILGRNCRVLQGPGSDSETIAMMRTVLGRGETLRCEILNYRKNGTPFWNGLTISPLRDATGAVTHFVSVQRDVTAQRALQDQLRFLALHDPVTGLPNRTALDQYLSRSAGQGFTAVGIIDLDDFKNVNDAYGHETGDSLLTDFARRLLRRTRDQDFLARIGGDEFVVVITNLSPENAEEELGHVAEALHDAVDTGFTVGHGVRVWVRMSMGLALCPPGKTRFNGALRRADAALYQQKARKAGRDKWWHLEDLHRHTSQEEPALPQSVPTTANTNDVSPALASEYRNRLFDGGLRMYFQPIINLRTNKVHCLEALTWLVRENGSIIPAAQFLPLLSAEETNALLRAGLDEALSQLTAWDALDFRVGVSVNLSPSTLINPDCSRWVAAALKRHNIAPERLTLELLQTHTADEDTHCQGIQQLLDLGVSMALDDLGSGHSTLKRLTALPFNTVKINRQLLHQFTTSPVKTMTFLSTMIHMGQDMGWGMIAEGLEDASLTEAMRILGIPYGQGLHIARPMPPEHVLPWITTAQESNNHDLITTFAGALAYHWQFTRLKAPHTGPLHTCPLTTFLEMHPAEETAAELHRQLHTCPAPPPEVPDELLQWLVNNVTADQQDEPAVPFRHPALLETQRTSEDALHRQPGQAL
jgi:diguanylate cyclase (GGDEF)-like protein/PAS domain S-box-containing protein